MEQEVRNFAPKMIFIHQNGDCKRFDFCKKNCEDCLIRFTCFTNKVTAFDLVVNDNYNIVSCTPHPVGDECE